MKNNINRNIRAIAILDFVIGITVITVHFLCQIGIVPHWCPDNFNLSLKLWVSFLGRILFLISAIGLLQKKEWARKAHYALPLFIIFASWFGIAYTLVVWSIITKDKFKEAF